MIKRTLWLDHIQLAWSRGSIVRLSGTRRVGKMTLDPYSQVANLSELSRSTVKSHIEAMQIAHAVHLLWPFHGGGKREIVSHPRCYAFDTGFVTFEKGWDTIRNEHRSGI